MEIPALLLDMSRVAIVLTINALPLFLGCQTVGAAGCSLAVLGCVTAVFVESLGNKVFDVYLSSFAIVSEGLGGCDKKGFKFIM